MKEKFLEISNVSKTFPGVKALDEVQFEICPGEVHALVGENGAGKSTLIKILAGVYTPDLGAKIKIGGEEAAINGPMDAIKRGISVIYQDFSLFTNLTVAENIGVNELIEQKKKVLNWPRMRRKAAEALKFLEADINPLEIVGNLSVAKQQMVAIATAVAQDAKMIIMDEPTSALSEGEVERLYQIIDALKERGIAIMFVGHKMNELFHVADRFTVFRDGKYVGTRNKADVTEGELISMMVGREVQIRNYANLEEKGPALLAVEGLSKKGNFKDITFEVHQGEVLGVTGLVGAGRSEVMQAIFRLNKLDAGKIMLDGQEVTINNPSEALRHGIAYIPESRQTQGLVLQKTIESNILLPVLGKYANKLGILDRKKMHGAANKWIEMLDVRPRDSQNLAMSLSGGNQQKVVIAKWVSTEARVLIVDEPTNGVDIGAKDEIHKILRKLASDGAAVIVISSDLPEVLSISDRIMIMRHGRVAGFMDNEDLTQEMIMDKAIV